jgi:hypothetical protein
MYKINGKYSDTHFYCQPAFRSLPVLDCLKKNGYVIYINKQIIFPYRGEN